jgi:hypothetical protein
MGSRMRVTPEQLTQALAQTGGSVDTLKHRIRADIASQKYTRLCYVNFQACR